MGYTVNLVISHVLERKYFDCRVDHSEGKFKNKTTTFGQS